MPFDLLVLAGLERCGWLLAKPGAEQTEADWTDSDMPGLAAYPRSKTIAERTAWDFIDHEVAAAGRRFLALADGPTIRTQPIPRSSKLRRACAT